MTITKWTGQGQRDRSNLMLLNEVTLQHKVLLNELTFKLLSNSAAIENCTTLYSTIKLNSIELKYNLLNIFLSNKKSQQEKAKKILLDCNSEL